jgi:hypothetical protein
MSDDLLTAHAHFENMREEPDIKPDEIDLQNHTNVETPSKGMERTRAQCVLLDFLTASKSLLAKKSPAKMGGRPVKDEVTGGGSSGGGYKPTSKDMAYHYVMYALSKVTPETRREIAEKLGVKQKNLDAVRSTSIPRCYERSSRSSADVITSQTWSINWK